MDQIAKYLDTIVQVISKNWLPLISLLISVIALSVTWVKNIRDRRHSNDRELLNQLKESLDLAYDAIAIKQENGDFPINSRLRWLTSARHIARYWELKTHIKTKLYVTICEEHEEFWRYRFYTLLKKIQNRDFFEYIDTNEMGESYIEPTSAAIVYAFSTWSAERPDPLDGLSFDQLVIKNKLFLGINRPFRMYIENKFPNLAKKVSKNS